MKKIKIKKKIKVDKPKKTKKKKDKRFNFKSFVIGSVLTLGIVGITLVLVIGLYVIITSPDFDKDLLYQSESTVIYDVNGDVMVKTGENSLTLVTYDDLPEVLVDALVATEDSRFFQHSGFDAARFLVASFNQVLGNSDAGGASTLSMQVIKNTYTSTDASGFSGIIRKLTDIYMSIFKLETSYTKEEIIEFYVNSQWLGNDGNVNYTGITGVEEGSQYLFGKSVSDLSLAEASLLAGMFQSPVAYNPYNYPENARERQTTVLTLMVRHGYITQDEMDAVLEIPIESLLKEQEESGVASYLQASIDYVIDEANELLKTQYGEDTTLNVYNTSMEIYTTIDPEVQEILYALETGESYEIPESFGNLQFGVAITSVTDGSIVALSAGIDYTAKGTNRATVQRQPGSTIKVIMDYGPYIEYLNGSPATYFIDEPWTYSDGTTSVKNWDNAFDGIISMRDALVDSRNIPALQAFQQISEIDQSYIEDFAHSLGIDYGDYLYESASIGGFDGVSPLELSAAYAAFARGGYYIEPYSVTSIVLTDTNDTIEYKYTKEKVMSSETAYLITDMLVSAGDNNVGGFKITGTELAAKTGTTSIDADAAEILGLPSSAIMDSWVTTYNTEYSMSLWVGYDSLSSDYYMTSSNIYSVRAAMNSALGKSLYSTYTTFDVPDGIVSVQIEADTFPLQLASENTPSSMILTELFKEGTEPTETSVRYATLEDVTNVSSTIENSKVTITWDVIDTPDALSTTYLTNYFNTYFGTYATQYYEERLEYNSKYIGTLVYDIYVVKDGNYTYLGNTSSGSYTTSLSLLDGYDEILIRSSYTIYTACDSEGVSITIDYESDDSTDDFVSGDLDEENDNQDDELDSLE